MKTFTVFLDMDGVLANLESGITLLTGDKNPASNKARLFNEYLPSYVKARGFELEGKFPNSERLVDELHKLQIQGKINIAVLTSSGDFYSPNSEVVRQKKAMLERNFPELHDAPFCVTTSGVDKSLFANENSMLIDDREKNIIHFINAGGHGITYTPETTVEFVLETLSLLLESRCF